MSERTFIKTNKPERPINKTKVKNQLIISETTLKPKADKESEKNKNYVLAEKDSITESSLTTDKTDSKTSKAHGETNDFGQAWLKDIKNQW